MIPLKDENPVRITLIVNWSLIAINTAIFLALWVKGPYLFINMIESYGATQPTF